MKKTNTNKKAARKTLTTNSLKKVRGGGDYIYATIKTGVYLSDGRG